MPVVTWLMITSVNRAWRGLAWLGIALVCRSTEYGVDIYLIQVSTARLINLKDGVDDSFLVGGGVERGSEALWLSLSGRQPLNHLSIPRARG